MNVERFQIEAKEKWMSWIDKIPYIRFKSNWHVQVIPPFFGAMARFRIRTDKMNPHAFISVYLDCYNALGYMKGPYWEVYPHDGDTFRCSMIEVDLLIKAISQSVRKEEWCAKKSSQGSDAASDSSSKS